MELVGIVPFGVVGPIITLNNFLAAAVLGPFLLWLLYPRAKRWDILWTEIMEPGEISRGAHPVLGALLMWAGGGGGLLVGIGLSIGLNLGVGGLGVVASVFPCLLLFVLGCLLA